MYLNRTNSFNDIYTTFYKKSYLFVKSYVHDDMAAEDIVAESLIKLWERMKQEVIDPVHPFLFTILKNRSLDYLKHQVIKKEVIDSFTRKLDRELEIRTFSLEVSDPKEIFSLEIEQIIHSTLNSLPERTREIFLMSRMGSKSHKEIAEFFQISVKGVDYHISQAVSVLRLKLKDYLPLLGFLSYLN